MTVITSQTTFTIQAALETVIETADIGLTPENPGGSGAMRELRYPNDALPPLVYEENPDAWENFDTDPLTARPLAKGQMTIGDYQLLRWPGFIKDNPVREIWKGSDTISRMSLSMFRRLWEYFTNPPASGYITWSPKDRVNKTYNIEIVGLRAGNATSSTSQLDRLSTQEVVNLDYFMSQQGQVLGEIVFSFIIVGEAD
jgi:hypothetical protein